MPLKSYMGWKVDFRRPEGEVAFTGPDSVSWRIFKNRVAVAIGGVAAVLIEFADARIRSGVWEHSTFKSDPAERARRTALAAMIGVFGPQSAALRVIRGVTNMHSRVSGATPAGEIYRALDPELLDWVGATATHSFMIAYDRFVAPLSLAEQVAFCQEAMPVTRLYGSEEPIDSPQAFGAMLDARLPRFEPHPIIGDFLAIMTAGRAAPGVPKAPQRAIVRAAVSLLRADIRERIGLAGVYDLSPAGASSVRLMAQIAETVPDLAGPAAQASARLGLPRAYLWTRRS